MKTSIYSFVLVFVAFFSSFAQTIRRVNNTAGLSDPSVYLTAQAAHNAAETNDIISLEPSLSPNYGPLVVTKRINIVGNGYYLDKNPGTTFDKRTTTLTNVDFDNGSANSTISGVELNQINIRDQNITVNRCLASTIVFNQGTSVGGIQSVGHNAIITNNLIYSSINGTTFGSTCGGIPCTIYTSTNTNFSNNIIFNQMSSHNSAIINHNTFMNSSTAGYLHSVIGSTVTNNIFDARGQAVAYVVANAASTGTTISNSICLGATSGLPTGAGNVNGASPTTTFVGTSTPGSTYTTLGDNVFQLAVGSPAATVAVGGGQAGAFGNGTSTYRLSGVPANPTVTSFISTGSGNNTTPLSITISVKSNN